jgi:pantothenate synthetase
LEQPQDTQFQQKQMEQQIILRLMVSTIMVQIEILLLDGVFLADTN